MKNRSILLSIFILIITFTVIVFTIDTNSQTISRENVMSTSVKSEVIEDGIELEKEVKEGKSFTTTIELPVTKIEVIDDYMRNWSLEKEDIFFSEIEQLSTSLSKKAEAHIVITPIVKNIEKHYLTYEVYSQYIIKDSTNNEEIFHSEVDTFTFNLQNEQLLSLDQIINLPQTKEDSQFKNFINTLKNEAIKNKFSELSIEEIKALQWMITDKGLIFLFSNDDEEHKIEHQLIEFTQLEPILTDSYKKKFIKAEVNKQENKKEKDKKSKNNNEIKKQKNKKLVALTFDDGPEPDVTPEILKTLKKYEAKATFFMLVNSAKAYPNVAKQVAEEGHEVANHSFSHVNLSKVKRSRIEKELKESKKTLEKITGAPVTLFRPPYGEYNKAVLQVANDSQQKIIMWSVDPKDWYHRNKNETYKNIMKFTNPGSIVLMHDIHQETANALPKIIKDLKEKGYEFVTVSELIEQFGLEPESNGVYYGK